MPMITAAPGAIRRHLLIAATATYGPGFGDISAGVHKEIETARTLFLDLLGYDRSTFKELVDPGAALQTEVSAWRRQIAPTANDWLLVYYTGHGVERHGALHLITSHTQEGDENTAPTADALARALLGGDKVPPHALLILDTCHSGTAHSDVTNAAARVRESTGGAARAADFHVVATARSIASASVGRFMESVTNLLRSPLALNPADEHVDIQHLVEQVNGSLGSEQRASYSGAGESALRFIPNPRWQPRLRPTMDRETRARVLHRIQIQALRSHWDPRARGVSNADTAGWYFTGRAKPIGFINQWLSEPSATRTRGLIVTALAGSGKSALLARIATLADPLLRQAAEDADALSLIPAAEVPNPGAIDAAVHARAKDAKQLALEMAAALDVELSSGGTDVEMEMVAKVADRAAPFTIIIDALDESVRPEDCALLLRKLANKSQRGRLIVGVRESGTEPLGLSSLLGPAFERIDLDAPRWRDPDDVRRYVERYLQFAPGSPYGDREAAPVTRRLADAVARRADTSFLVASATAYALASRSTVGEPADLEPLPATVGEALELDLERFGGVAGEQLRHVLTALACAEGRGLPRDMWLAMAAALSNGDVADSDLDRWSKDAAFYLVHDEEFGERVRRLYHEEFAAHLRRGVNAAGDAAIADALLRTVPRAAGVAEPEWDRASTYLLAFYSRHLNRAGRTRDLSELSSTAAWIKAKRQRFGDIGWVLADLDLAINAARAEHPAALARLVRGCTMYAGFVASAPPIVIDTVAGLQEPTRAQAMAETIEFPLDRCHAFALVAARWAALGMSERAIDCVRTAERAAHGVRAHFETMAIYWVVRAARIAGDTEVATRLIDAVRGQLAPIRGALDRADPVSDAGVLDDAKLEARVRSWAETRSLDGVHSMMALPHWLFWASMCFRHVGDVESCSLIRDHVMALETGELGRWFLGNLVLQTAAVTGAVKFLRDVARTWWDARSMGWARPAFAGGVAKPGNVALALIDVGLWDEFDRLRADGAFDEMYLADSTKRYAWALARRGDFDVALNTAARIGEDHEEQARALYRIGREAVSAGKRDVFDSIGSAAAALQAQPHACESWRVDSWLGAVMLMAGRTADARALAEAVSAAGVVAGESTCLAMATPGTARMKGHVRLDADATAYAALRDEVLERARSTGTVSARDYLKTQPASVRTTAELLLNLATMETDPARAFDLWVDAIIASRRAATTMLRNVLTDGASILAHSTAGETLATLLATVTEVHKALPSGR